MRLSFLVDAFRIMINEPKLFLPKIFLSGIWGAFMLLFAAFLFSLLSILSNNSSSLIFLPENFLRENSRMLFSFLSVGLVFTLIDIAVNAMYPYMLQDYFKKQGVHFRNAFANVFRNSLRIFPPIIASLLIMFLVMAPFALLILFSYISNNPFYIIVSIASLIVVILLLALIFYFIYPVSVIEKLNFFNVFKRALKTAKQNFAVTLTAILIVFILTIVSLIIALALGIIGFIGFIIVRVIQAVSATYQMTLNPVIYLEFEKHLKPKGVLNE